jgi:hypothetical protein
VSSFVQSSAAAQGVWTSNQELPAYCFMFTVRPERGDVWTWDVPMLPGGVASICADVQELEMLGVCGQADTDYMWQARLEIVLDDPTGLQAAWAEALVFEAILSPHLNRALDLPERSELVFEMWLAPPPPATEGPRAAFDALRTRLRSQQPTVVGLCAIRAVTSDAVLANIFAGGQVMQARLLHVQVCATDSDA